MSNNAFRNIAMGQALALPGSTDPSRFSQHSLFLIAAPHARRNTNSRNDPSRKSLSGLRNGRGTWSTRKKNPPLASLDRAVQTRIANVPIKLFRRNESGGRPIDDIDEVGFFLDCTIHFVSFFPKISCGRVSLPAGWLSDVAPGADAGSVGSGVTRELPAGLVGSCCGFFGLLCFSPALIE